jgi:glutathione synthase
MASREDIESSYPPSLTAAESEQILSTIKDWSIVHGLAVRPPVAVVSPEIDPHGVLATTAPVTLFPSPFPRVSFHQAKSIQKSYSQLYASIAQDEQFLEDIVQE